MSGRLTRVLDPSEVQFLNTSSPDLLDEMEEEDFEGEDVEKEAENEKEYVEDIEFEEENVSDNPGPMEEKLINMSPEEINELMTKMQLDELGSSFKDDEIEGEAISPEVEKVKGKRNQGKTAPSKQEKIPTAKATKQDKQETSKSKKGRNKQAEPTEEENIDKKKNRGKNPGITINNEDNNVAVPSQDGSHANEDSKSKTSKRGKVTTNKEEKITEGAQDELEKEVTKIQNKGKETVPKNSKNSSKENKGKSEKAGRIEEISKSNRGKNKQAEPTTDKIKTDDISHTQNSVEDAGTKHKRGGNTKQHLEEEGIKNDSLPENEELPSKKNKGKKPIKKTLHEDSNVAVPSQDNNHANEDTKSKTSKRGKVLLTHKEEENTEGAQDDMTKDVTKIPNKGEEAMSKNAKKNPIKEKKTTSEKGKPTLVDNPGVNQSEVTKNKPEKTAKSALGKQKNTTNDLKQNNDPKDGMKKNDPKVKEHINERPKRMISKKTYTEENLKKKP